MLCLVSTPFNFSSFFTDPCPLENHSVSHTSESPCTCHSQRQLFLPLLRVNKTWFDGASARIWRHLVFRDSLFPDIQKINAFFSVFDSKYRGDLYAGLVKAIHLKPPTYERVEWSRREKETKARLELFTRQLVRLAPRLPNIRLLQSHLHDQSFANSQDRMLELFTRLKTCPLRRLLFPLNPDFTKCLEWYSDHLDELQLSGVFWTDFTDADAESLIAAIPTGIRTLSFPCGSVEVQSFAVHILDKLQALENITMPFIFEEKLVPELEKMLIKKAPMLKSLRIGLWEPRLAVARQANSIIAHCSNLETLVLDHYVFDERGLGQPPSLDLSTMLRLKRLRIYRGYLGDTNIDALELPKQLETLELAHCYSAFDCLAKLFQRSTPNLVTLDLDNERLSFQDWVAISTLGGLKRLYLAEVDFDMRFLEHLMVEGYLPALEILQVSAPKKISGRVFRQGRQGQAQIGAPLSRLQRSRWVLSGIARRVRGSIRGRNGRVCGSAGEGSCKAGGGGGCLIMWRRYRTVPGRFDQL